MYAFKPFSQVRTAAIIAAWAFGLLVVLSIVFAPELVSAQSNVAGPAIATPPGGDASMQGMNTFLERTLWTLVNVLFGWMVYVGGMLLDFSINHYVIGFGKEFTTMGIGAVVDSLWIVVRDMFNLTFIFGLVYIGLRMIFDSNDANAKRMLGSLIMAALLVNFSLFITKFVIDFANIAAIQLVNVFPTEAGAAQISGTFMHIMGLTGAINTGANVGFTGNEVAGGLGYIFGTMILYVIAAFVFLAGGLLLCIRFAVLNLYMILSPLMFIGWVFPSAASFTSTYWKGFLGRAFFAPAYILMLYFAQRILSLYTVTDGKSLADLFNKKGLEIDNIFGAVVPPFVLTAVFLIAAIVVAQKMSSSGVAAIDSMQNNLMGRARGLVKGAAIGATYVPRKAVGAASGVAGRYAVRKTIGTQRVANWNAKANQSGFTLGAKTRQNIIDGSKKVRFGSSSSVDEKDKSDKERKIRDAQTTKTYDRERAVAKLPDDIDKLETQYQNEATPANKEALEKAIKDLGDNIKNMSTDEIANISIEKLQGANLAVHLSDKNIEALEKDAHISKEEAGAIKGKRGEAYIAAAKGTTVKDTVVLENIFKKGTEELGNMPPDFFKQASVVAKLDPQVLDARRKNGGVSQADADAIIANIQTFINTSATDAQKNKWKTWTERSLYGSGSGLIVEVKKKPADATTPTLTDGRANYDQTEGGILTPSSSGSGPRTT